jgi:hypothetical protein
MLARTRIGLVVGIIGLVLNEFASGFRGITGTILSLVAAGVAGFFAARKGKSSSKRDGARAGAIAGGFAGGVVLIGQLIGAMATLFSLSSSQSMMGKIIYILFGAGTGFFLWIIIALLAAGIGAAVGYLATPSRLPVNN